MRRFILILGLLSAVMPVLCAQQVKDVTVSDGTAFEETLQFPFDDKGLELRVSIAFDEEDDRLDLVIVGSRTIMAFRQDVRYRDVFDGLLRNMKPERLPFPVLVPPGSKFHLDGRVWKGFSVKRKNHLFNRWIENISEELTPRMPATSGMRSVEAMMVTDSIVQRFSVAHDATDAHFSLRNILVTDVGRERGRTGKVRYDIVMDGDLNTSYHVLIQRNPCFHTGPLADSLRRLADSLGECCARLVSSCPDGRASSIEEEDIFNQHRAFLLNRYPDMEPVHDCPSIQEAMALYVSLRDSVAKAPCRYVPDDTQIRRKVQGKVINSEVLLNTARTLDLLVSKILITSDRQERLDLISMGHELIMNLDDSLADREIIGEDIDRAVSIYNQAKSYFYYSIIQ